MALALTSQQKVRFFFFSRRTNFLFFTHFFTDLFSLSYFSCYTSSFSSCCFSSSSSSPSSPASLSFLSSLSSPQHKGAAKNAHQVGTNLSKEKRLARDAPLGSTRTKLNGRRAKIVLLANLSHSKDKRHVRSAPLGSTRTKRNRRCAKIALLGKRNHPSKKHLALRACPVKLSQTQENSRVVFVRKVRSKINMGDRRVKIVRQVRLKVTRARLSLGASNVLPVKMPLTLEAPLARLATVDPLPPLAQLFAKRV